ncbi:MAG: hypothetical protein B6242_00300 [Anaerolineaceae bacterium 4572_78]|nr:MAG: hypothetical protein B6242_00300 [Anaerolineaceae bacterium 4572_78]
MVKQILIVDSDKGFSTILSEGLNTHPAFNATVVHSGVDALRSMIDHNYDLIIIDMGIADASPVKLIEAIRELEAKMPVMIIPFIGQGVPANISALGIQGVLPKPFFVGDLPKLVGKTVGLDLEGKVPDLHTTPPEASKRKEKRSPSRPKTRPPSRPKTRSSSRPKTRPPSRPSSRPKTRPKTRHPSRPRTRTRAPSRPYIPEPAVAPAINVPTLHGWKLEKLRKSKDDIIEQLKDLNGEVRAEVILLMAGTELIAMAGNLSEEKAQELALLVAQDNNIASQAAALLGERDKTFEQSLHEGNQYRLYSYTLEEGVVLTLAVGMNVPLGMLRHQTRRTGRRLTKYIG